MVGVAKGPHIEVARKPLRRGDIEGTRGGVAKALSSLSLVIPGDTAPGAMDIACPKPEH
jgi:hypothetical protein